MQFAVSADFTGLEVDELLRACACEAVMPKQSVGYVWDMDTFGYIAWVLPEKSDSTCVVL